MTNLPTNTMPGSVHNLAIPGTVLPAEMIVDTNLIVTRFLAPFLSAASPTAALQSQRAQWFFGEVASGRTIGFVTPRVLDEVLHVQIKAMFANDVPNFQADLQRQWPTVRRHTWSHLFKIRPQNLRQYAQDLTATVNDLVNFNLYLLQPWDLDALAGIAWEEELVRRIKRYQTDTADTSILLEAERVGVMNVATLDKDYRNAHRDFHIYTWV